MRRLAGILLSSSLLLLLLPMTGLAQTPAPRGRVEISSPAPGATVGGTISIIGTVSLSDLQSFWLEFGPGTDPQQWIPIGRPRDEEVAAGRLALWDTTQIPDGLYTVRLRALRQGQQPGYSDYYVSELVVFFS